MAHVLAIGAFVCFSISAFHLPAEEACRGLNKLLLNRLGRLISVVWSKRRHDSDYVTLADDRHSAADKVTSAVAQGRELIFTDSVRVKASALRNRFKLLRKRLVAVFFLGSSRSFIAHIISEKCDEINKEITGNIDRGSTIIDVTGGYTGKPRRMLMVSFTMNQYSEIINAVNKIDKNAFVTVHQAREINGEGWTR